MNWKTWIPLVLALALGLVAAKVGRDLLRPKSALGTQTSTTTKVVVAKRDLSPGQVLGEKDLVLASVPADNVASESFRSTAETIGRVLIHPLMKDQAVLGTALAPAGSAGGPHALVPRGMRAVTVEVNEYSGLAGLVGPGCHVDVVSTLHEDSGSRPMARTIVQNVKVLAVGQRLNSAGEEEPVKAKSVTLIVTPKQAEAIDLASSKGRTRLVLRGLLDETSATSVGVSMDELMGTPKKAVLAVSVPATRPVEPTAAKTAPPPQKIRKTRSIEVISGNEVSKVEFELPAEAPTASTDGGAEAIPGSRVP